MNEVDLYKPIIEFVNSTGSYAYRNSVGGRGRYRFGKKGQADISGIIFKPTDKKLHGRRLEIEVKKSANDELREDQEIFLFDIRSRGGITMVVTSLDEVIAEFKRLGLCQV